MAYEELPPVVEAKALLAKPAPQAADKVPARGWRGHWLHLFGKGSPEDVTACCLAYHAPCVAFGWNHRRGLGLGFWREALRFVALCVLCDAILHGIRLTLLTACGPPPPVGGPLTVMPGYDGPGGMMGSEPHGGMMMGGGPGFGNSDMPMNGPFPRGGGGHGPRAFPGDAVEPTLMSSASSSSVSVAAVATYEGDTAPYNAAAADADESRRGLLFGEPWGYFPDPNSYSYDSFYEDEDDGYYSDAYYYGAGSSSAFNQQGQGQQAGGQGGYDDEAGYEEYGYSDQDGVVGDPAAYRRGGPFLGAVGPQPRFGGPGPRPEELMDPICVAAVAASPGMLAMYALLVAAVVYQVYYVAARRAQLRERFGIPGSFVSDCCLWAWCSVCALAQETRTLMANNVHEGVWYGEVPGAAHQHLAAQHAAPAAQRMAAAPAKGELDV